MAINNIPGVGPANTDVANAVAAVVPTNSSIASAVAAANNTNVTNIVQTYAGAKYYVQEFNSSTNWTAPANTYGVHIIMVGGGGGGGSAAGFQNWTANNQSYSYASPGAGGQVVDKYIGVTPNTTYAITVGTGGAGANTTGNFASGPLTGNTPGVGNDSAFGNLVTAYGGSAGKSYNVSQGNGTGNGTQRWGSAYGKIGFDSQVSTLMGYAPSGFKNAYTFSHGRLGGSTGLGPSVSQARNSNIDNSMAVLTFTGGNNSEMGWAAGEGYGTEGLGAGGYDTGQVNRNALNEMITFVQGPGSGGNSASVRNTLGQATAGNAGKNGRITLEYWA